MKLGSGGRAKALMRGNLLHPQPATPASANRLSSPARRRCAADIGLSAPEPLPFARSRCANGKRLQGPGTQENCPGSLSCPMGLRGYIWLRSPPKASQESNRLSTDLPGQSAYLGVGIVVTMPPGAISVLVPLPLLVKSPWPARTMAATAIVNVGTSRADRALGYSLT
jgi:hypothetical protein